MSFNDFNNCLNDLEQAESHLKSLEDQVTAARITVLEKRHALWDRVKRARNGFKAKHGDNSTRYNRVRATECRNRNRKAAAPKLKES